MNVKMMMRGLMLVFAAATTRVMAVDLVPGTIHVVPSIASHQTYGGEPQPHNMLGMGVTMFFSDTTSESATWVNDAAAGPGGQASGPSGWTLANPTDPNDTFNSPWVLSYGGSAHGSIVGFELDGFAGGGPLEVVAFDVTSSDVPVGGFGTDGSFAGKTFDAGVSPVVIDRVEYRDAVRIQADAAPVGDLYRFLKVEFANQIASKWDQLPVPELGENLHSDIDWRLAMETQDRVAVADDFISDGRPITAVRWWGSYFDPENEPKLNDDVAGYQAQVEEGFLLSFFADQQQGQPDALLGSYIAPVENVTIKATDMIGWDQHRVWEYEVDLSETLLDHASDFATPEGFREEEGVEYWLSIAAENGHQFDLDTGEFINNGDEIQQEPFWGWHTTPQLIDGHEDAAPVQSNLFMPGGEWEYIAWDTVQQAHADPLNNMAFQLLTPDDSNSGLDGIVVKELTFLQDTDNPVPEPTAMILLSWGILGMVHRCRNRVTRT